MTLPKEKRRMTAKMSEKLIVNAKRQNQKRQQGENILCIIHNASNNQLIIEKQDKIGQCKFSNIFNSNYWKYLLHLTYKRNEDFQNTRLCIWQWEFVNSRKLYAIVTGLLWEEDKKQIQF